MKNPTSSAAALVSLLSSAAASSAAGDASRCRPLPTFVSFTAASPTTRSGPSRESCGGGSRRRSSGSSSSSSSSSSSPFARPHPEASGSGWSRGATSRRPLLPVHNLAASRSASAAAAGPASKAAAALSAPGMTGSASRRRRRQQQQQQQQRRWGWGRGREGGGEQQRGWCARAAGTSSSFDRPGGVEAEEDRGIRRLDLAVRMVFADYYSCTDVRETTKSLAIFLQEAIAALELGSHFSDPETVTVNGNGAGGEPSPALLASRLKERLLESAEKLTYHLDGDAPMVLYRLWTRGRAVDVYERDLLHCPRWIELVAETRKQIENAPVVVEGDMGTVCYPNGDMFEGQVDSLIRMAEAGTAVNPKNNDAFVDDAGMVATSADPAAAASRGLKAAAADVRTIPGLVSLTIDCLEDGLSDEATILQRHMKSPDFGHPLLRLASPSDNDPDHPHVPDDPEMNPALLRAEQDLTEEDIALGERGAKELMHDRRRAQLDVYLVCAAYRQYVSPMDGGADRDGWHLHEEDGLILDELLKQAAAIETP